MSRRSHRVRCPQEGGRAPTLLLTWRRFASPPAFVLWPLALAILLAAASLVWPVAAPDLAAQTVRATVFTRAGMVPWWGGWYGGLQTTTYSLLTPALMSWWSVSGVAAAVIVAAPLAAAPFLAGARRPCAAGLALVTTVTACVVDGRVTFSVGLLLLLGALSAAALGWPGRAAGVAFLCAAASPVAGVFAVMIAAAVLPMRGRRAAELSMSLGGACGLLLLWWLSAGETVGREPYNVLAQMLTVGVAATVVLLPVGGRVRAVAVATVLLVIYCREAATPLGSNVSRLVLVGAPVAVAAQLKSRAVVVLAAVCLAGWATMADLTWTIQQANSSGVNPTFVAGLRSELQRLPEVAAQRVEVVDVASHWPTARLVGVATLARGWERQTDEALNPELYSRALTPLQYRRFLDRNAVALVALPLVAPLDFGSRAEARLIATGVDYLRPVWQDAQWTLYAVHDPLPVVAPPAADVRLTDTGVRFVATHPGRYVTTLRWSVYLSTGQGRLTRTPDGYTAVMVPRTGPVTIQAAWRLP